MAGFFEIARVKPVGPPKGFWFILIGPISLCLVLTGLALAQAPLPADVEDESSAAFVDENAQAFPQPSQPDTVRTNIWLTEALLGEVVARAARVLPPPPAAVRLTLGRTTDADGLLKEAMVRVLGGQGYTLYLPEEDEARLAAVDYQLDFYVVGIELDYPDVGRTLGIWRQWVDRELTVTAQVEISAEDSGLILFSDRIVRSFADRVSSHDFDHVDSSLYDFTTAETKESGWKSRMEEIVVLGALAGLVAVYFTNTTD